MEFWDIYDIHRIKTGRTATRGDTMGKDDFHMVVASCIFNRRGCLLIQQRQPFKEGFPNLWDVTAAGSTLQGETSQQAMERELREELGLALDLSGIRPNLTINFDRGFEDFYLLERDVDTAGLQLQPEEVQAVKWATLDEILTMIDVGTFIPYYKSLIRLFFDSKERYGCHSK